jgi:nicotinamide-nucleotide amidase
MKAEIVSVGTEMLLGMIVDTNAQYLTLELAELGVDVFWISQVGDNLDRVVDVINRGLSRSDAIIVTGGLGPTEDDLTRESIAAALGEELAVDPELEHQLRENFARRARPMPERNVKQATLIPSARGLPNPIGTAPGWWVDRAGKIIVAMPGVPAEMKLMWAEQVKPTLARRAGAGLLLTTNLKVLGLGESAVEELLGSLIHGTNPTVATYAKADGVHVRVSAKAEDEATARRLLAPVAEQVEDVLGEWVYGRDDDTLAAIAGQLLAAHGWTLASAESGTGGTLGSEIGEPGPLATQYLGGFLVGREGALLGPSATPQELATAARERTGADVGVAAMISPGSGPASSLYAVDVRGEQEAGSTRWNMGLPELRRRCAIEALALLVRTLRRSQ